MKHDSLVITFLFGVLGLVLGSVLAVLCRTL